jgi:hypothetical protein
MRITNFLLPAISAALIISGASLAMSQTAQMLRYAEPVEGTLGPSESVQYTFEGASGDKPIIIMNAKRGEVDPVVSLYDPVGQLIGEDNNSNGKMNARLENIVLPQDGIYTVEAGNVGAGGGEYSLIINEESQVILFHGEESGAEAFQLTQPWPHNDIRYQLHSVPEMFSVEDVRAVITQSFQAWANQTPLTFTEVSDGSADINIAFDRIDGPSNILGQACPPSSPCAGEVIFDVDENWVLFEPQYYDDISMLGVATHEFGHAVGLLHSNDTSALMYAQYSPYNLQPNTDDIQGVQRLYGAGSGGVFSPTPGPGSGTTANGDSQVNGEITDDQYVHFWDFDVQAGETITLRMEGLSGGLDSFLILLDANDNLLAFDDDSGGGLNAEIRNIRLPQTGTYTVAATRFQQVQGYSVGEYALIITYGEVAGPSAPPAAPVNPVPGDGTVNASRVSESALQEYPFVESLLQPAFVDVRSPQAQSSRGTVQGDVSYVWNVPWCAADEATLRDNLNSVDVSFSINEQAVDPSVITQAITTVENGLVCANHFVLLSGWQPGEVLLRSVLHLNDSVYDGFAVYEAGDYTYNAVITAR